MSLERMIELVETKEAPPCSVCDLKEICMNHNMACRGFQEYMAWRDTIERKIDDDRSWIPSEKLFNRLYR